MHRSPGRRKAALSPYAPPPKMVWREQHCARCGKAFESRTKRPNLYCSQSCRQIAYMKRNNIKVKKIYIREKR